ncbi:MAG: SPFH domain-containing protein, partial [Synergistaceae bacterium]|nr:SPFH domain-containing protein [Synergistaceae bacterium]
LLRDPEYQVPLNVRAYGQFGIRITESRKFLLKLAGSKTQITRDDLVNYFRGLLLSRMGDMLATYIAKKKVSIFEINAYLRDMSDEAVGEIKPVFEEYGIEPVNFYFGSVNVPDDDESVRELKRAMTERARMNLKGYTYQQERSFDVLQTAAGNTGGEGGGSLMNAGVGLGTGMGLGGAIGQMASQMGQYVNPMQNNNMQSAAPALTCPKCGKPYAQGSAFCPSCGTPLAEAKKFCSNCGAELDASMKFCPKCGKQA